MKGTDTERSPSDVGLKNTVRDQTKTQRQHNVMGELIHTIGLEEGDSTGVLVEIDTLVMCGVSTRNHYKWYCKPKNKTKIKGSEGGFWAILHG